MTGYVVTRWYRAPEVILNWMHYTQTGESLPSDGATTCASLQVWPFPSLFPHGSPMVAVSLEAAELGWDKGVAG